MKGIFMRKNEELYLLIGKVETVDDFGDNVQVVVTYERRNRGTKEYKHLNTRIVVRDKDQGHDGKKF